MATKLLDVIVTTKTKNGHVHVDWTATRRNCYKICEGDARREAAEDPDFVYSRVAVVLNTQAMIDEIRKNVRKWGNNVICSIYELQNKDEIEMIAEAIDALDKKLKAEGK